MPQGAGLDLANIRRQYPDYDDLSDGELVDAIYTAHYSDMPRERFDRLTGFIGRGYESRNTGERTDIDLRNVVLPDDPQYAELAGQPADLYADGFAVPRQETRYRRALDDAREDADNGGYGFTDNAADAFTLGLQGPFNGLMAGIGQGVQNLMGEDEYGPLEAFNATRQARNEQREEFGRDRPVQSVVSGLLGGLGSPVSRVGGNFMAGQAGPAWAQGGGLLGTMGRGAAVGIPAGAAYGLTTSDPGEELQDTAGGAVMGGVTGLAVPAVVAGGAGAARRIGSAGSEFVDSVVRGVRGRSEPAVPRMDRNGVERWLDVNSPGERQVQQGRDYFRDMADWSNVDINALRQADPNLTAAEAMGPNAIAQAGAISRRAGQTPQLADDVMTLRQMRRPDRIVDSIAGATGTDPRMARASVEEIVDAGRQRAAPLYDAVRDQDTPVMTDRLRELMNRPAGRQAVNAAVRDLENQGISPTSVGFRPLSEPIAGMTDYALEAPNARTWDLVKKALGSQVERNQFTNRPLPDSQSSGNFGLNTVNRDLTNELRDVVPGYGEALDAGGDYLSVNNAFERSGNMLTRPTREFSQVWDNLGTDGERYAAQARLLSDISDLARSGRLRPSMFRTPDVRDNLELAFPGRADEIVERMAGRSPSSEVRMQAAESRMRPNLNSTTSDMMENQQQAGEAAAGAARNATRAVRGDWLSILADVGVSGIRGARTPIPMGARDEVGRILYGSPDQAATLLEQVRAITNRNRRLSSALTPGLTYQTSSGQ